MAISTHTTHAIDITDVEYLRHGDKPAGASLQAARQRPVPAHRRTARRGVVPGGLPERHRAQRSAGQEWHCGGSAGFPHAAGRLRIRPPWPTSTMASAGARRRLQPGAVARTGSAPRAVPVARTRPCCSACARTIRATLRCHTRRAPHR